MSDMQKVAHEVPGIMQMAAQHLTKLAAQNVELVKRAEALETELKVMKIARRMELRGLHPDLSFEEKVAQLHDLDPDQLDRLSDAVELVAGGVKLPSLRTSDTKIASNDPYSPSPSGDADDELELYITSQAALT